MFGLCSWFELIRLTLRLSVVSESWPIDEKWQFNLYDISFPLIIIYIIFISNRYDRCCFCAILFETWSGCTIYHVNMIFRCSLDIRHLELEAHLASVTSVPMFVDVGLTLRKIAI